MLGFLIGLVGRQPGSAAPPPEQPPETQQSALLTEAGDFLLQDAGGRFILE